MKEKSPKTQRPFHPLFYSVGIDLPKLDHLVSTLRFATRRDSYVSSTLRFSDVLGVGRLGYGQQGQSASDDVYVPVHVGSCSASGHMVEAR